MKTHEVRANLEVVFLPSHEDFELLNLDGCDEVIYTKDGPAYFKRLPSSLSGQYLKIFLGFCFGISLSMVNYVVFTHFNGFGEQTRGSSTVDMLKKHKAN
jgi:hypothetical protein